jgi:hypothetical protein
MFIADDHIWRASSDTDWACISKRPAIDRIACGSVIKRVAMLPFSFNHLVLEILFWWTVMVGPVTSVNAPAEPNT